MNLPSTQATAFPTEQVSELKLTMLVGVTIFGLVSYLEIVPDISGQLMTPNCERTRFSRYM